MTPMTRRPAARRSLSALGLGALAIAALGAFALPAAAQTPRGAGPGFMLDFDAIDADGDGRITLDEIRAYRQARAAALDADGDGFVTRDELLAFRLAEARTRIERQVDRVFAQLDLDGDGRLGAAELLAGQATGARRGPDLERMFARIDRNGDGAITREEIAEMHTRMQSRQDRGERRGRMQEGGRGDGKAMRGQQERRGGSQRPAAD